MHQFIKSVTASLQKAKTRRSLKRRPRHTQLRLEALEGRVVPSNQNLILETLPRNFPSFTSNPNWASDLVGGHIFYEPAAISAGYPKWEWTQVLYPQSEDDLDVGVSGTAVNPMYSLKDVPFNHPFGNDFEFFIAPDPKFTPMLARSNRQPPLDEDGKEYRDAIQAATNWLHQDVPGVLGVETDQGLVPVSYQPHHGDRVAVFGQWIVDTGHDDFHTEIHPPRLIAAARPITPASTEWTTSTVVGRPYRVSQEYLLPGERRIDPFLNGGTDDGALVPHMLRELDKVLTFRSLRLEAHPGIIDESAETAALMFYTVRPPTTREDPGDTLLTSFHFTVRDGVTVAVIPPLPGQDEVLVGVLMNPQYHSYKQAPLPRKTEVAFYEFPEVPLLTTLAQALGIVPADPLFAYYAAILGRGVLTDRYDTPRAASVHDFENVVENLPVSKLPYPLPTPASVDNSDSQPFPIYGYINVGWQRAARTFTVNAPANSQAGTPFLATITAKDRFGNIASNYRGTVHFTSTDGAAGLPADYTFTAADQGVRTFTVNLRTAGPQSLTVSDTANGAILGRATFSVNPADASTFSVTGFPSPTVAGVMTNLFTVTAQDPFGNTATSYRGTIHLSSTDGRAVLPGDYTFTAADNGTHTFNAILRTSGTQALTATDTSSGALTGTQAKIVVNPADASTFLIQGFPLSPTAGLAGTVTVTARDPFENTATGYRGTVHFTSSDGSATLPGDYTFTAADNGAHTFSVTLRSAGHQPLSVTDTANRTITGSAGTTTEFPIPTADSLTRAITAGPDGNLWFAEYGVRKIGRITPDGTIAEFPLLTASGPYSITLGPDGNLWFAAASGKVGRITPDGTVTEFPTPTANSNPTGITAGPDGNLWFTEYAAHKIGRITPDGSTITEFPTPTTYSLPYYITAGPDGNLWFTEFASSKIGRITPSGTITEFPVFTAGGTPYQIITGPDGNLWFSEVTINRLGRITPDGTFSEFLLPTVTSSAAGLTIGPDGNLWFTEDPGDRIGRIGPDGAVTEFAVPTARNRLNGITAGPDGNLWFTENAGNKIGRLMPAVTVSPARADHFLVSAPAGVTANTPFDVSVTALDPYGNPDSNYRGTVTFTSTDTGSGVLLPAAYTFTAGDSGMHTFAGGVTLVTLGRQTVTVADTVRGITGSTTIQNDSGGGGSGGGAGSSGPDASNLGPADQWPTTWPRLSLHATETAGPSPAAGEREQPRRAAVDVERFFASRAGEERKLALARSMWNDLTLENDFPHLLIEA
jgi:streptogramin lyase